MLAIDTNAHETDLFNTIASFSSNAYTLVNTRHIVRESLQIGDVALRDEDGATLWSFEIKRGADWSASILDHRLEEQRRRAKDNPAAGTFAYILEGIPPPNDSSVPYGRLPASSVYGSLLRTSLRDGLHVFYTRNARETADLLLFALLQERAGKLAPKTAATAGERGVGKRKRDWSLDHPTEAALLSIPGMGDKVAKALADEFGSLGLLLAADEKELADVVVGKKRRLGPALAKKIKAL